MSRALALSCLLLASSARAQPPEEANGVPTSGLSSPSSDEPEPTRRGVSMVTQRARALFEQALAALRRGRAAAGRDMLRRSLAILPTVATRYNLALALQRTGESTEAVFLLERLLRDELTDEQRRRVRGALAELRAEVASLEIHVAEGSAEVASTASIEVDGVEVGAARPARPLRVEVDAGRHVVSALAGRLRGTAEARVARGERRVVRLTLAPFVEPPPEGGDDPWPWVVTALVVAAAGAAVGTVLGLTLGDDDPYGSATAVETLVRF